MKHQKIIPYIIVFWLGIGFGFVAGASYQMRQGQTVRIEITTTPPAEPGQTKGKPDAIPNSIRSL